MFVGRLVNAPIVERLGTRFSLLVSGVLLILANVLLMVAGSVALVVAGFVLLGFGVAGVISHGPGDCVTHGAWRQRRNYGRDDGGGLQWFYHLPAGDRRDRGLDFAFHGAVECRAQRIGGPAAGVGPRTTARMKAATA
jgi:hypothetical protein